MLSSILAFLAPLAFMPSKEKKEAAPSHPVGSYEHFEAWLASKNPNESYDWRSSSRCLFAQYGRTFNQSKTDSDYAAALDACAKAAGCEPSPLYEARAFGSGIGHGQKSYGILFPQNKSNPPFPDHVSADWTFGAALERLRFNRKQGLC